MNNNIIKDSASDFPPLERLSVIELLVVSTNKKEFLFIHPDEIEKTYPIPAAFEMYMPKE